MDWAFLLYSFVTIFVIIDPVANIPLFAGFLEKRSERQRKRMIRQAILIAGVVLVVLALVGKQFFQGLGVNMYSFRVAGGILLFIIAIEMLFGKHTKTEHTEEENKQAKELEDLVVTPMAIPLLTGPGAITTAIVLFDSAKGSDQKALAIAGIVLAFLASWAVLEFGEKLSRKMGPIALKVIVRVMGLVLAGIAVQMVFTGASEAFRALWPIPFV